MANVAKFENDIDNSMCFQRTCFVLSIVFIFLHEYNLGQCSPQSWGYHDHPHLPVEKQKKVYVICPMSNKYLVAKLRFETGSTAHAYNCHTFYFLKSKQTNKKHLTDKYLSEVVIRSLPFNFFSSLQLLLGTGEKADIEKNSTPMEYKHQRSLKATERT